MTISIQTIAQHANRMVRAERANNIRGTRETATIVLFEVGNTYEAYNESAEALHAHCDFRMEHEGNLDYVNFKKTCEDWVFPRMVRAGHKLCIVEN